MSSPGGNIVVTVSQKASAGLCFRVALEGREVLADSPLGIRTAGREIAGNPVFTGRIDEWINDRYRMVTGKKSFPSHLATQMTLNFRDVDSRSFSLIFRAADDGIAYRYFLPGEGEAKIVEELSGFRLPSGSVGWLQSYRPNYENPYVHTAPQPQAPARDIGFPALFQVPEAGWVLLSEASLYSDYAGARLFGPLEGSGDFRVKLPGGVISQLPWWTPWRVAIVGLGLGPIVESVLVESLNPPSEITDTNWIRPGRVTFPWWSDHFANGNPDKMKSFVNLAAEMGWEWLEFDLPLIGSAYDPNPRWRTTAWIPELIRYAGTKGILCYGWDGVENLDTQEKRADILGLYEKLGLRGIKIDYLDDDSQRMMRLREEIIRDCAARRMMVSFHGETVPRGQRRRFPNVMTLEGVKGAEWYTLPEFGKIENAAIHNCTLPFTRNVVGPMDYTPVSFSAAGRETTEAHELALPFIFESGWTCIADTPAAILNSPGRSLLKLLPVTWDDIRFLDGFPGEFVCLARRKGNEWFIAGINASKSRTVEIPTAFLGGSARMGRLYSDGEGGRIKVEDRPLEPGVPVRVEMAVNGGFCLAVSPRFSNFPE